MNALIPFLFTALLCSTNAAEAPLNQHNYWYGGEAEITSYALTQARYGEMREGKAVMVFVTEPFSPTKNAKSDTPSKNDVSVLKLNFTKNFNTGIYPYSMMTSTFFPFHKGKHSLKVSSSSQEWCGHTYMELTNNTQFNINIQSYFEGESAALSIPKTLLEDDVWSMIRLQPHQLPTGNLTMVPAFFYLRLMHQEAKGYNCVAHQTEVDENTMDYTLNYPTLQRELTIRYERKFPHHILSWTETYESGFGSSKKQLTTTGTRLNTMKSAYWTQNHNKDAGLRKALQLE